MPNIYIAEIDTSTPGVEDVTTNAVYIPGLAKSINADLNTDEYFQKPVYFETLADFRAVFGNEPYVFGENVTYGDIFTEPADSDSADYELYDKIKSSVFIAANSPDKSYIMASELLAAGLPVYYECMETPSTGHKAVAIVNSIYDQIYRRFDYSDKKNILIDKGETVFKFLTTGGYPVFSGNIALTSAGTGLTLRQVQFAASRGDLIAIVDYFDFYNGDYDTLHSALNALTQPGSNDINDDETAENIWSYGAMFAPYSVYNFVNTSWKTSADSVETTHTQYVMPASYGYLITFAASSKNNPNWYAAAGASRGAVANFVAPVTGASLTSIEANEYQKRNEGSSINSIVNIKPYGYLLWGNRTLKNNSSNQELTATSFLNIRHLSNDVKRQVFVTARKLTFEPNSDILWINFKSNIIPLLDQMVTGNGITGYQFIRQATTKKATLKAKIVLECIEAVEDFDITIELTDAAVAVTEG